MSARPAKHAARGPPSLHCLHVYARRSHSLRYLPFHHLPISTQAHCFLALSIAVVLLPAHSPQPYPLQEAFTRMQTVKSLAKAVSKEMADSLKGTEELLTLALTKAQKDNNTVYLERVPPFAGAQGAGRGWVGRGWAGRSIME